MAETGYTMKTGRELQQINNARLTGQEILEEPEVINVPEEQIPPSSDYTSALVDYLRHDNSNTGADFVSEAVQRGYGTSRFDKRTPYYSGIDIEDVRARQQSGASKILSGVGKGGIKAAGTALNTVAGTLFGVGAGLFELATDTNGNGRSFSDTIDAGVNNWLSENIVDIQNKAEELFPINKTAEERSPEYQKEWYKHMGTPSFIGDSILANFGFTVGAMGGGYGATRLLSKLQGRKRLANNLLKGVVAASKGDAEADAALKEALQALRAGKETVEDAELISKNLVNAGKKLNAMNSRLQTYGVVLGAMGEGSFEGLMAKNEFLDKTNAQLEQQFAQEYNSLEDDVYDDGFGVTDKLTGITYLSDKGVEELNKLRQNAINKYNERLAYANAEGKKIASTDFLLNQIILIPSNAIQFSRLFSGGWKTARSVRGVKGGLTVEPNSVSGAFKGGINKPLYTVARAAKVAGSEAAEEMLQGFAASGVTKHADYDIAAYNNSGYTPEESSTLLQTFADFWEGGTEYLSDVKNWQEGMLGALTGLFGIPGKFWKTAPWKGGWNGGLFGEIAQTTAEDALSRSAAEELNKVVNSEDFQNRWHDAVRHKKFDSDMAKALAHDDPYAWHSADRKQLISDVMAFARAGKLEDLSDMVEKYVEIDERGISDMKDMLVTDGKTDKVVAEKVREKANDILTAIKQYTELDDALSELPIGTTESQRDEILFTGLEMKQLEKRFLDLYDDVMKKVEPKLKLTQIYNTSDSADESLRIKNAKDIYDTIFKSVEPIKIDSEAKKAIDDAIADLKKVAGNDAELKGKISDLAKISDSRRAFYEKFRYLQTPKGSNAFNDTAITQAKVAEEAGKEYNKNLTEGLNTFKDVKDKYLTLTNPKDKDDFMGALASEKDNKAAKDFIDLSNDYFGLKNAIEKKLVPTKTKIPANIVEALMWDAFQKAESYDDFQHISEKLFPSEEEFSNIVNEVYAGLSSVFGKPNTDGWYDEAKQLFETSADEYYKVANANAARKTVNPNEKSTTPANTVTGKESNYDSAQQGSDSKVKPGQQPPVQQQPSKPEPEKENIKRVPTERGNADRPSDKELQSEAIEVGREVSPVDQKQEIEKDGIAGRQLRFYHTSINEIDSFQAREARNDIKRGDRESLKTRDLRDFYREETDTNGKTVKINPAFEETWTALKNRKAFDALAYDTNKNDKVEFIIDPTFPKYDGKPQVLVRSAKNGQILTVLSIPKNTDGAIKYKGLNELRFRIREGYRSWLANNRDRAQDDIYVFSDAEGKPITSTIWAKRPGLVDYDFSGKEEHAIINTPGYKDNAPIVFIDGKGEAVTVRGNDKLAGKKVNDSFGDPSKNRDDANDGANSRIGNLYYLANVPNGKYEYAPIRLFVKHYNKELAHTSNQKPIVNNINDALTEISDIVQKYDGKNTEDSEKQMRPILQKLKNYLDIHDVYFGLRNFNNIGPALKLVNHYKHVDIDPNETEEQRQSRLAEKQEDNAKFIPVNEMTADRLMDTVASFDKPIQLSYEEKGNGYVLENLNEAIEQGLITTNARMMRPKGTDIYFFPWNDKEQAFLPDTGQQAAAVVTPDAADKNVPQAASALFGRIVGARRSTDQREPIEPVEQPSPKKQAPSAPETVPASNKSAYDKLTDVQKENLKAKDISPEVFNDLPEEEQELAANC